MGLYVETYNIQQNLRHPVVVSYNNKIRHSYNHKNTTPASNSNVASSVAIQSKINNIRARYNYLENNENNSDNIYTVQPNLSNGIVG